MTSSPAAWRATVDHRHSERLARAGRRSASSRVRVERHAERPRGRQIDPDDLAILRRHGWKVPAVVDLDRFDLPAALTPMQVEHRPRRVVPLAGPGDRARSRSTARLDFVSVTGRMKFPVLMSTGSVTTSRPPSGPAARSGAAAGRGSRRRRIWSNGCGLWRRPTANRPRRSIRARRRGGRSIDGDCEARRSAGGRLAGARGPAARRGLTGGVALDRDVRRAARRGRPAGEPDQARGRAGIPGTSSGRPCRAVGRGRVRDNRVPWFVSVACAGAVRLPQVRSVARSAGVGGSRQCGDGVRRRAGASASTAAGRSMVNRWRGARPVWRRAPRRRCGRSGAGSGRRRQ